MALLVFAALRAHSWREFAPPFAAACLSAYAAAGSWAYVITTPIVFGVLLLIVRRSGLQEGWRADRAWPTGRLPRHRTDGCWPRRSGAAVRGGPPVGRRHRAFRSVRGVTPVEPTSLAGAVIVGLGVAYVAYRWSDCLSLVTTLLMAAASSSAILVFLTGVLPKNTPTYALTKSLYVVLAISTLAADLARRASVTVSSPPHSGDRFAYPGKPDHHVPDLRVDHQVAERGSGARCRAGTRILRLAASAKRHHTVACLPSPYIDQLKNYLCNRWAESLAPRVRAPPTSG